MTKDGGATLTWRRGTGHGTERGRRRESSVVECRAAYVWGQPSEDVQKASGCDPSVGEVRMEATQLEP